MKNPVKSLCGGALFVAALCAVGVFSTGCEWESSGSEGSWNDSMSWVNFSGLYRSGSSGRPLVSNFSLSSGGTVDTGTDDGGSETPSDFTEKPVTTGVADSQAGLFTTINKTINYNPADNDGWSLKPGSVTVNFVGGNGAQGSFTDNGGGGLVGTFSQAQGGTVYNGTGSINYDTGAWSLSLEASFLGPANISYGYTILLPVADADEVVTPVDEEADDGSDEPPTSGDWVYTLQIAQTGNRLSFTDNRGFVWEGALSSVTTPGGDDTGRSPGDVVGTFEVKGVTDARYKITGTFSGAYLVETPEEGVQYGVLTTRRIQGVWMEPSGNGDLYGETTDGGQTAISTTATTTE